MKRAILALFLMVAATFAEGPVTPPGIQVLGTPQDNNVLVYTNGFLVDSGVAPTNLVSVDNLTDDIATNAANIAQNAADIITATPGNYSTVSNNAISAYDTVEGYAVDPNTLQTQVTANATAITSNINDIAALQISALTNIYYGRGGWDATTAVGDTWDGARAGTNFNNTMIQINADLLYGGAAKFRLWTHEGGIGGTTFAPYTCPPVSLPSRGSLIIEGHGPSVASTAWDVGSAGESGDNWYNKITGDLFTQNNSQYASNIVFEGLYMTNTASVIEDIVRPINGFTFTDCQLQGILLGAVNTELFKNATVENCEFVGGFQTTGLLDSDFTGAIFSNTYFDVDSSILPSTPGTLTGEIPKFINLWSECASETLSTPTRTRSGHLNTLRLELHDCYYIDATDIAKVYIPSQTASSYFKAYNVTFTNTTDDWQIESSESIFVNCTNVAASVTNFGGAFTNCTDHNGAAILDQ